MKKFISTLLTALMLLSSMSFATTALAEDTPISASATNYTVYDFSKTFADKANWFTGASDVSFTNNSVTINQKEGSTVVGYHGQKFGNEILEFKMNMQLLKDGWPGIAIRNTTDDKVIWDGNNGYLFVFQGDYIEVQRWSGGAQKFILVTTKMPPLKDGDNTIQVGAVNTDAGVNIILNANGIPVVNALDTDPLAVKDPGYVTFYNSHTTKLSAIGNTDPKMPPVALNNKFDGTLNVGETLTASYDFADPKGAKEKDSIIQWYISDKPNGDADDSDLAKAIAEKYNANGYVAPGVFKKIEGANSLTYTIKPEDDQKYIMYTITPKNESGLTGYETRCNAKLIDSLPFKLEKSIAMLVNSEFAFVNNKKCQIDPDNYDVVPTIVNDRTLLPVRFIAESLGATVNWDADTQTITFTVGDKEVKLILNQTTMTVNGQEVSLDVAPTIIQDRTMLPVRAVSEAIGKKIFWDPKGLIVISDEDNLFNSETDAKEIDHLIDRILNENFE